MNKKTLDAWRRRAILSDQIAAQWQAKIDGAPSNTTKHQIGVWRAKMLQARKQADAYRNRIKQHEGEQQ